MNNIYLAGLYLVSTSALLADSLVYQQGDQIDLNDILTDTLYTHASDVELRGEEPTINFNTGSGDNSISLDGSDGGAQTHVVLRFEEIFGEDAYQIPPGSQIDSATLTINITNRGDDFTVYRLADGVDWMDSTATWNDFGPSANDGVLVGTETEGDGLTASGDEGLQSIDVTAIIAAWSNGDANNGLALIPGGSNGVDFDSSESTVVANRPQLTIDFTRIDPNAPAFTQTSYILPHGRVGTEYTQTLSDKVNDPDNDVLRFSKTNGPDWLAVSSDGQLSGMPTNADIGDNTFTVSASDDDGSDVALVQIAVDDANGNPLPASSNTARYRLVWLNDPATTMIIAWDQLSGNDAVVHYGPVDQGRIASAYPFTKHVDRSIQYRGMNNRFVHLSNLLPDTVCYFVLQDDTGVSERYSFRTAPDTPQPFTFIAGGDSRNNREPRQAANQLVAKLRPLFVAFTGDMISSDSNINWLEWMDDWQGTISADGRMYPLLPHRGNHENGGNTTIDNLFDTTEGNYYGVTVGGDLLRFYVLNSESNQETQAVWLESDLSALDGANTFTHLCAGYHKPMRPHTSSKSEGSSEYSAWSQIFYDNRFDLVFESDSHTMKRTYPIRPSTGSGSEEGFVRDDVNGTIFVGEGCWGAPLRDANDAKAWTAASASFNGFDWAHVYDDRIEVFTVQVDTATNVDALTDATRLSLPRGIDLWSPADGARHVAGKRSGVVRDSFSQWQLNHFGPTIETGETVTADYDQDGLNNINEFAFGLNPKHSNNHGSSHLPYIKQNGKEWNVRYRRPIESGIQYGYEYSNDLVTWTPAVEREDYAISTSPNGSNEEATLTPIGAWATTSPLFIRVTIAQ